jgi:hypothetical protein
LDLKVFRANIGMICSSLTLSVSRNATNSVDAVTSADQSITGKAIFGVRPLGFLDFMIENPLLDALNLEVLHEQVFIFDRNQPNNLGLFSEGGLRPDRGSFSYKYRGPLLDASKVRSAISDAPSGNYQWFYNNCQDWGSRVRNRSK